MWHYRLREAIEQANEESSREDWCFSVRLFNGLYGVYMGAYEDALYCTIFYSQFR